METWAIYGSLLLAGLTGSLHCVGMCGPILVGFAQVFGDPTVNPGHRTATMDFTAYHIGRLWTYALFGFAAGFAGRALQQGGAFVGWQKGLSIAAGVAVVLSGLLLAGVLPGPRIDALLDGCQLQQMKRWRWFAHLIHAPGFGPRLLVGVVMGFLPCGLVYAMLVPAATLPTPLHSAGAMLAFGIGTLPALTAVLAIGRAAPRWIRRHGTRIAAVMLIVTGVFMIYRSATGASHGDHDGHGAAGGHAAHYGKIDHTSGGSPP